MNEADKRHFWEMLQGLATSTKSEITVGVLKVYWLTLGHIPRADFDKAVKRAVDECEWFPSVAELLEFAGRRPRARGPHYLRRAEDELERIETCQFHTKSHPAKPAPRFVPWCRKCRRLALAANGKGRPQPLGELLQAAALAPLDPGGEQK